MSRRRGIEKYADDRQIEGRPRACFVARPARRLCDLREAIDPIDHEMPPARMEWNIERRIGPAGRGDDQIGGRIEPGKIDAKIRQPVFQSQREHALRARAHGLSAQQGNSRRRIRIHGIHLAGRSQYLSSERPTESVRSCGLGASGE